MPLRVLTAAEALQRPTVVYNHPDGSGRTYGAKVERLAARPSTPPAFTSVTSQTTGGTLTNNLATSYRYTVVARGVESLVSAAGTVTTDAVSTTNQVTLTIPVVAGAEFYRIYTTVARTAGTELLLTTQTATGSPIVFVDTGAITPSGAQPSGALPTGAVTLRIPNIPGSDSVVSPKVLGVVEAATSVGQAGRYEYHRI